MPVRAPLLALALSLAPSPHHVRPAMRSARLSGAQGEEALEKVLLPVSTAATGERATGESGAQWGGTTRTSASAATGAGGVGSASSLHELRESHERQMGRAARRDAAPRRGANRESNRPRPSGPHVRAPRSAQKCDVTAGPPRLPVPAPPARA